MTIEQAEVLCRNVVSLQPCCYVLPDVGDGSRFVYRYIANLFLLISSRMCLKDSRNINEVTLAIVIMLVAPCIALHVVWILLNPL